MGKINTQTRVQSAAFINHSTFSDGVISKPELKKLVPSVVKLVGHDDVETVNIET